MRSFSISRACSSFLCVTIPSPSESDLVKRLTESRKDRSRPKLLFDSAIALLVKSFESLVSHGGPRHFRILTSTCGVVNCTAQASREAALDAHSRQGTRRIILHARSQRAVPRSPAQHLRRSKSTTIRRHRSPPHPHLTRARGCDSADRKDRNAGRARGLFEQT